DTITKYYAIMNDRDGGYLVTDTNNDTEYGTPQLHMAAEGATGDNVTNIQRALRKIHCWVNPDGSPSDCANLGLFSSITKASVIKFVREYTDENPYYGGNSYGGAQFVGLSESAARLLSLEAKYYIEGAPAVLVSGNAKGNDVAVVQTYIKDLNDDKYKSISVDGDYGDKTAEAVTAFQKGKNIDSDGIVGYNTWNNMGFKCNQNDYHVRRNDKVYRDELLHAKIGYLYGIANEDDVVRKIIENLKELKVDSADKINILNGKDDPNYDTVCDNFLLSYYDASFLLYNIWNNRTVKEDAKILEWTNQALNGSITKGYGNDKEALYSSIEISEHSILITKIKSYLEKIDGKKLTANGSKTFSLKEKNINFNNGCGYWYNAQDDNENSDFYRAVQLFCEDAGVLSSYEYIKMVNSGNDNALRAVLYWVLKEVNDEDLRDHLLPIWWHEKSNSNTPFILSGQDVVFNNPSFTWKYISQSDYNDYEYDISESIVGLEGIVDVDKYYISCAPEHLKGNEKLNLTPGQLAFLYQYDSWGVKMYLTAKNSSELTKGVFKILCNREPKYYTWIDGSWNTSKDWSSLSYSEADAGLTCFTKPHNLAEIVTAGLIATTMVIGAGEVALVAEGISEFGFVGGIGLYNAGLLSSSLAIIKGVSESELAIDQQIIEEELTELGAAETPAEVNAIKSEIIADIEAESIETSGFIKFFNTSEAQSWGSSSYSTWKNALSASEKSAITAYTGDECYQNINAVLRGLESEYEGNNAEIVQELSQALSKSSIPQNITLYRGASKAMLGNLQNLPPEELVGEVISDKAFMSTSLVPAGAFNGDLTLIIEAPSGAEGAYIGNMSYYPGEAEVLLNKG
ncbi:MAG TPA: ADP-ribosyltransferase, partial [Clostridia bacterium]